MHRGRLFKKFLRSCTGATLCFKKFLTLKIPCDILYLGKPQDKRRLHPRCNTYRRALALRVSEGRAMLMKLSDIISALSLVCNIVRAVVAIIKMRHDAKKQAATTTNSDGLDAK